ncbi:MAG: heavy-metal-associated domain-containing protein [Bacteroidaceae bacterium]|nr:heavy-metal-associated domain-containing protein [Bacteroidaceae bacterium]
MESKTFSVSGMNCPHCKANVEKALQSLQGVTFAEANLQAAEVRVEYDETLVSPEDIKQTVDNSGRYELTL